MITNKQKSNQRQFFDSSISSILLFLLHFLQFQIFRRLGENYP